MDVCEHVRKKLKIYLSNIITNFKDSRVKNLECLQDISTVKPSDLVFDYNHDPYSKEALKGVQC